MEQSIIKIGNSYGLVIPLSILKQFGLKKGSRVLVSVGGDGKSFIINKAGEIKSSITPEFYSWLEKFNKKYDKALKELAEK